jgi:hypothetical protein
MSTFDKREEGFELKFAHEEEVRFKARARRNKMLGLWAAEKLGLDAAAADAYSKEIVMADRRRRGVSQAAPRLRRQDGRAVRPPDPPHHGRADGEGGRGRQGGTVRPRGRTSRGKPA